MTITPRRILFWLHLTSGCIAGTVIFFLAITGTCLAFERQVIAWADHGHQAAASNDAKQPIANLIAEAEAYGHASVTAIAIHSSSSAPVEITTGREPARVLLFDPHSGVLLGESAPRLRAFFTQVTALHRWFGMQSQNRTTAHAIKGAFTLAMLFLVCSGVVLWLPRKWTRQHVGKSMLFRGDLKGRARDWNWHNVIGIWIAAPIFIIVLTGVIMAYPWANDLLYRLTGNAPPPRQSEAASKDRSTEHKSGGKNHHITNTVTNLDALFSLAGQQIAEWRTITLRIPNPGANVFAFQVDRGDGGRPDLRAQVTIDSISNHIINTESFYSYNEGRRLRLWARFTHTGEAFGIPGETVTAGASLGAAALIWTGFSLAFRRFRSWRNRRSA